MTSGESNSILGDNISWLFVSFLFASVIASSADKFATLIRGWRTSQDGKGKQDGRWPALFHLILAWVVVVTSWVGWSVAMRTHNELQISSVFSSPTLVLVIDIMLLVSYFALVAGIDVKDYKNSAAHVVLWILVISIGYLAWDLTALAWVPLSASHFGYSGCVSVFLVSIAIAAFYFLRRITREQKLRTCLADCSLIFLFLAFRAAKHYAEARDNKLSLPLDNLPMDWTVYVEFICGAGFLVCAAVAVFKTSPVPP